MRFAAGLILVGALSAQDYDLGALHWRNIGPNRGGRSQAVAGSARRPLEYYFGATGGGLWKTTNGGVTWFPVTDGQIHSSSVGAVAVAPSNPDVVYIGMGETELRGNIMQGDGVYKSIDAGKTWKHVGLADTQAIARIRIDPANPDLVYVAALGHPYGPNEQRGVFRSSDGGARFDSQQPRGRSGSFDGFQQSASSFRNHLGCIPYSVEPFERRTGQRIFQIRRWRHQLDGDHAKSRVAKGNFGKNHGRTLRRRFESRLRAD
jgi:hypothetical protein